MEIILSVPSQKYVSLVAAVACMIKAIYSIIALVNGYSIETLNDTVLLVRDFSDIIAWLMVSTLLFHIFLYREKHIGRSSLNMATVMAIVSIIIKVLSTIVCTLFFINSGTWSIVFSAVELLILFWALLYISRIWYVKRREKRKLLQNKK